MFSDKCIRHSHRAVVLYARSHRSRCTSSTLHFRTGQSPTRNPEGLETGSEVTMGRKSWHERLGRDSKGSAFRVYGGVRGWDDNKQVPLYKGKWVPCGLCQGFVRAFRVVAGISLNPKPQLPKQAFGTPRADPKRSP